MVTLWVFDVLWFVKLKVWATHILCIVQNVSATEMESGWGREREVPSRPSEGKDGIGKTSRAAKVTQQDLFSTK